VQGIAHPADLGCGPGSCCSEGASLGLLMHCVFAEIIMCVGLSHFESST
jgi:hypothetical protein